MRADAAPASTLQDVSEGASDDYIREKLDVAVDCLATSASSIQLRLANAMISALSRLNPDDFNEADERALFENIEAAMTSVDPDRSVSRYEASAEAMSDESAVEVARWITDLRARVIAPS